MQEGETSSFLIPWQRLYGEQGIPGNLPQRSDLSFTINLQNLITQKTQKDTENMVATITEETTKKEEEKHDDDLPMHLSTYMKIAVQVVIEHSETKFSETKAITNTTDKQQVGETLVEVHNSGETKEHTPVSSGEKDEASEEKTTENSEKKVHTTSTNQNSNIKQVFKTVITALWPEVSDSHFLFHSKPHKRNP